MRLLPQEAILADHDLMRAPLPFADEPGAWFEARRGGQYLPPSACLLGDMAQPTAQFGTQPAK